MGGGAAGGLWRHQQWSPSWPPSWILPRIRNQVKTARNCNFLCLTWKITHKYVAYFHSKMAWPPATYDVISRNHRNWPSLNLSQNACKWYTNSYWKHQVLMLYPLGKYSEKPQPPPPPSPLYTRRLIKFHYENHENHNKTSKWNKTMIGW